MTVTPRARTHLVERAVEALNDAGLTPAPPQANVPPPATGGRPYSLAEQAVAAMEKAGGVSALAAPPLPPAPPVMAPAPKPAPLPSAQPRISMALLEKAGMSVTSRSRSRLSEEIAVVQNQVLRTARSAERTERRGGIVLVTSARPGEGKSFCSLNIAAGMAIHGAQLVLLVDADGKRQCLSELLGCADAPGLRNLAAHSSQLIAPLILPTDVARLSVLTFGTEAQDQDGRAAAAHMVAALQRVAAALPDHVIVIDTPPCLSTSDPSTFAAIADQVVMVVEAERTQRNEVEAALDMVDTCPNIQLLLNRVELAVSDAFGAYGVYDSNGKPQAP